MSNWIRLHTAPKICRMKKHLNAKERYLFFKSLGRYNLTEDGQYMIKTMRNLSPEIGHVESVRFIESKNL